MVFVYIALAIVVAFFITLFCQNRKRSASEAAKDKAFSRVQVGYLSQSHNIRIPASAKTVTYAGSTNDNGPHIFVGANHMWKDNDSVCFFPVKPTRKNYEEYSSGYSLAAFPLDHIVYYATRTDRPRIAQPPRPLRKNGTHLWIIWTPPTAQAQCFSRSTITMHSRA